MLPVVHVESQLHGDVAAASVTIAGAGTFTTPSSSYPLGAMVYTTTETGRGVIQLKAGAGAVALSGTEATHPEPRRYRLTIDRIALISQQRAQGVCDLGLSVDGATYQHLSCRGVLGPMHEPFQLTWSASAGVT